MNKHGNWISASCASVATNLRRRGYSVWKLDPERLPPKGAINALTPIKGTTGVVKYLYERAFGVEYPNLDLPAPLARYARYAERGEF
ncbi:MAG: hypothetical protein EBY17_31510 [Acidobacteriia bacterium]|nr:hypothetical protein [Terriglobia bacterium]